MSSNKKSNGKGNYNRLTHYMKAPYRALIHARDLYINSLGGCAGRVQTGRVVASRVPRGGSRGFYKPRTGGEDDINELIRAASQGRFGSIGMQRAVEAAGIGPRSQSVGVGVRPVMIGRIDEEEPCEFNGDVKAGAGAMMHPRSRSCAVGAKGMVVGNGMVGVGVLA